MTLRNKIEAARTRIADLKTERDGIEAQRRSRKEVAEYLDATIAQWASTAEMMGRTNAARAANGAPAEFLTIHAHAATPQGPVVVSLNLGPLAVMLLGSEAVRKATGKALSNVPEGLGSVVRTRRLHEIDEALHAAQIEEEMLIREAEQAGDIVMHRPDADPAYVLRLEA